MLPDDEFLARARAAAEARMVDACTIRRRTGEATVGYEVAPTYTVLYDGRCEVDHGEAQAAEEDAGQARLLMVRRTVKVPMSATGFEPDDEVLITASRHDPDLPGRTFYVKDLFGDSHATSRRIGVVERTS